MSPAAYPESAPVLRAERGGLAPTAAPVKMHPSEVALTLSADVLRLPYLPAVRLVLAEIVSLYAATGRCNASDPHFAARLSVSRDTVTRAIGQLHAEGVIVRVTDEARGNYRTLTPVPAAIAAKSATNPYPQNQARVAAKSGKGGYPQNQATPRLKMQEPYPQNQALILHLIFQ